MRQLLKTLVQKTNCRFFSTNPTANQQLVNLEVNDKNGIATLTLNRPPVNSLNLELLTDISNALTEVETNRSIGLILTSAYKTVFSAGLDINELYNPQLDRIKQLWTTLQDVWLKLYGSSYPTAAAINGHAPAGGCVLAICCEYRVMCPDYTIGLNETRVGISVPKWIQSSFLNILSPRIVEKALTLGTMFTTEQAFAICLADEIAANKTEAISKSEEFLLKFGKVSSAARAKTKQNLRRASLTYLAENRQKDFDLFMFEINQPKVQKGLKLYMQSLKKK